MKSYSQFGHDLWVLQKTASLRGGYFVEAGAGDGIDLSNSYLLEKDYGWRGICVEPNRSYANLVKNRGCICVDCCLSGKNGEDKFYEDKEYHGHLSGLAAFKVFMPKNVTFVDKPTRTLEAVLRENQSPSVIDYLSLDTEGSELAILKVFPFDKYDIHVITVEHNHVPSLKMGLRELLLAKDFILDTEAEVDDWYIKKTWSTSP